MARQHKNNTRDTMIGCGLMIVMLLLVVSACNAVFGGDDEPERESSPEESPSATASESPSETPKEKPTEEDEEREQAPSPEPAAPEPEPEPAQYYENCDAARAAGAAPVRVGDPGYGRHLDRDGDGVGCET